MKPRLAFPTTMYDSRHVLARGLPPAPSGLAAAARAPDVPTQHGTLSRAMLEAGDNELVFLPGVEEYAVRAGELRQLLLEVFKLTPQQLAAMSGKEQNRVANRMRIKINRARKEAGLDTPDSLQDSAMAGERGRVYEWLRTEWQHGPLEIRRPPASSWHHLIEYDRMQTEGRFYRGYENDAQSIVVEHEWARVVPAEGVWRLPFEVCAWEFLISGVRVIAVTDQSLEEENGMAAFVLIYGHDGHWVCDDLLYVITEGGELVVSRKQNPAGETPSSLHRVVHLVFHNIRASCIMMDSGICRRETVAPSPALVKHRRAEGREPPRAHSVVRLDRRRPAYQRARTAGASVGSERAPQRGHWRRGTYVHFDDQDSGKEKYVNDGGFFLSRTWRPWHFAGDPKNLMPNREYRI